MNPTLWLILAAVALGAALVVRSGLRFRSNEKAMLAELRRRRELLGDADEDGDYHTEAAKVRARLAQKHPRR